MLLYLIIILFLLFLSQPILGRLYDLFEDVCAKEENTTHMIFDQVRARQIFVKVLL